MLLTILLAFAAAALCLALALTVLIRGKRTVATRAFLLGMLALGSENLCSGFSLGATTYEGYVDWQTLSFAARAFLPVTWLAFSLSYSRGDAREQLRRWAVLLLVAAVVPSGLAFGSQDTLLLSPDEAHLQNAGWLAFSLPAKILNGLLLVSGVLILTNLERTFRSAVGTMQWKIKFMIVGVAVIFGARIYTRSQGLLFSGQSYDALAIEAASVLIGCGFISIAYLRNGLAGVEVYPSRAVLQSSITFVLVGAYLFIVGVLAQLVALVGGTANFQVQALLVLVGIAVLAVLLLSRRIRSGLQFLVSRHFRRPQHDACAVWTRLTGSLARLQDQEALCAAASKLISETFSVLSVTFWVIEEQREDRLVPVVSTGPGGGVSGGDGRALRLDGGWSGALEGRNRPFLLDDAEGAWADRLREGNATQFKRGGRQLILPLQAGGRCLGLAVLGDRVNGVPYGAEELDLLRCIADQVAAGLLNLRLMQALMAARELEAFQTMSTFFVHDLKNATSGLNLMLKNLPIHFDNPEFREDALRGVGNTVQRIETLIARLTTLRTRLEPKLAQCDLDRVVKEALGQLQGLTDVEVASELTAPLAVLADPEQLESVVTNLLLNAREAVGKNGRIEVRTAQQNGHAVLSVRDNGCGMSPEFLQDSLFRPFRTTKKKGMGIGMFQSRMIIEAHRGKMLVESEPGVGTTFQVLLPLSA